MKLIHIALCLGIALIPTNKGSVEFTAQEGTAPNSVQTNEQFKVSVEIVLYSKQTAVNPVTTEAIEKALAEWSRHLPVVITVYREDTFSNNPFIAPVEWHTRPGVIQILIVNINDPPYNYPEGTVGLWQASQGTILLDDCLEARPEIAYSVVLHELGHFFGVPHIVNENDSGLTGYIMVPNEVDSEEYVMSPAIHPAKPQNVLSPIEIAVARNHLVTVMTNPAYSPGKTLTDCPR